MQTDSASLGTVLQEPLRYFMTFFFYFFFEEVSWPQVKIWFEISAIASKQLCCKRLHFLSFFFFVPIYYFNFLMRCESSGMAATGSWVPAPRQVCKFYCRLHSNVITLLPLSDEWNRSFSLILFFFFFLIQWNTAHLPCLINLLYLPSTES